MTYQTKVGREQGGSTFFVASGGFIRVDPGGNINAASGSITLPPNLKRGDVPLDIFAVRTLASGETFQSFNVSASGAALPTGSLGGLIGAGTVPNLAMLSTAAQAPHISWASGQTAVVAFPPVPIPPDFSSAGGLTIHAIAERASDNASNNVLDFRFFANQTATNKGTTGTTMTSTPAEYSITVSSAESGAHPGVWNFQILPGTHTNNAVRLFSAWAEYSRVTS